MAYLGREPTYGIFEVQTPPVDGSTTTFDLDYTVSNPASLLVVRNGLVQKPERDYNITSGGSQIVFTTPPVAGGNIFILFLGKQFLVSTVADGSLTRDKLSEAITRSSVGIWSEENSNFTAVAGGNYFIDTSGGSVTVTFPSTASMGDTIKIVDASGTFETNNCTVNLNGKKLAGSSSNLVLNENRLGRTFVYYNEARGWLYSENHNFA
jgi:hypothetical protein